MVPTFVVSLGGAVPALGAELDVRGVVGFPGRLLPDGVARRLTGDPEAVRNKGALGCMLAHLLAWQRIAALDVPALVLEDDVRVTGGLPPMPDGFDLMFCGPHVAMETCRRVVPIARILPALQRRRAAPGCHAYLVTSRGAERLLALFERDGYFGHVDMRMLAYACHPGDVEFLGPEWPASELRAICRREPEIAACAATRPLVDHAGVPSRREAEDAAGLTVPGRN